MNLSSLYEWIKARVKQGTRSANLPVRQDGCHVDGVMLRVRRL
jgi:hypothetical protein